MATEHTGIFTAKDADGNKMRLYPVTKIAAVEGLEAALADKAESSSLSAHTGDTIKHITAAERNVWNSLASAVPNSIPIYTENSYELITGIGSRGDDVAGYYTVSGLCPGHGQVFIFNPLTSTENGLCNYIAFDDGSPMFLYANNNMGDLLLGLDSENEEKGLFHHVNSLFVYLIQVCHIGEGNNEEKIGVVLNTVNIVDWTDSDLDASPQENSIKPVTSGGIYNAIQTQTSALAEHTANTTVHVTEAERTAWNGKANKDLSNVDNTTLAAKIAAAGGSIPVVYGEGTGAYYTATVDSITTLTTGQLIVFVPNVESTETMPYLKINGGNNIPINRGVSHMTGNITAGYADSWLAANIPVLLLFESTCWRVLSMTKPHAADLNGTVSIASGGTGQTTLEDTVYTAARYRGSALYNTEKAPTVNGVINWIYE